MVLTNAIGRKLLAKAQLPFIPTHPTTQRHYMSALIRTSHLAVDPRTQNFFVVDEKRAALSLAVYYNNLRKGRSNHIEWIEGKLHLFADRGRRP